ncbi:hypothetical protein PR202_gb11021 [Eleusine coracana subsp. coracana]|uniref:Uncharacterized protein n=1 Tax=Eleusine coracana subsp. coracana TaxID=191504 RepID=A0AAV5ELY6_ELECO|nr:hypothetical protein PR202_gb11021 [Eleusine coracana subsp. coracana]
MGSAWTCPAKLAVRGTQRRDGGASERDLERSQSQICRPASAGSASSTVQRTYTRTAKISNGSLQLVRGDGGGPRGAGLLRVVGGGAGGAGRRRAAAVPGRHERVAGGEGGLRRRPGGRVVPVLRADGLELGGAVAAVGNEEELQPGQLYFVLPAAMRRWPLQAEEMAALAVRASAALVGDGEGPLVFPEQAAAVSAAGEGGATRSGKGCRRSRRGSSRGRDFVPDLGAIAE